MVASATFKVTLHNPGTVMWSYMLQNFLHDPEAFSKSNEIIEFMKNSELFLKQDVLKLWRDLGRKDDLVSVRI